MKLEELKKTKDIELLDKFSNSKILLERITVSLNENCSIEILDKLSYDKSLKVLTNVIYHPNCTDFILERLYYNFHLKYDFIWCIREAILTTENCPASILKDLTGDESFNLLNVVIKNKNCQIFILKKIYKRFVSLKDKVTAHPNWKFSEFE